MDATVSAAETAALHLLDEAKPLRESLIWQLQSSFYEHLNIKAWSDAIVPSFVTSNAYIALCYARTIVGFIKDVMAK